MSDTKRNILPSFRGSMFIASKVITAAYHVVAAVSGGHTTLHGGAVVRERYASHVLGKKRSSGLTGLQYQGTTQYLLESQLHFTIIFVVSVGYGSVNIGSYTCYMSLYTVIRGLLGGVDTSSCEQPP